MTATLSMQNQAMPTHFNNTLPPVGPKLLLRLGADEYVKATRPNWITRQDHLVPFHKEDGEVFYLEKSRIWWTYP